MAGSVNSVSLLGNVGKDPEIRSFSNGGKVASFSLATSESWKDRTSGEKKERTEWHRISIFNENLVSVVERFVKKGSKVYLTGQLETRKWTNKEGVEQYTTEIVLKQFRGEIVLLDSKRDEPHTEHAEAKVNGYLPAPADAVDDSIPF